MHYCCRVYSRIHPSSCHHRLPMYVLYLFLYVTTLAPAYSSLFSTRGAAHEANKTNDSSSCTYGALASFSFGHLSLVGVTQSGIPPVRSSPIVYLRDMPVTFFGGILPPLFFFHAVSDFSHCHLIPLRLDSFDPFFVTALLLRCPFFFF